MLQDILQDKIQLITFQRTLQVKRAELLNLMITENFLYQPVPCDSSPQSIIDLNSSYTSHLYIVEGNFIQWEKHGERNRKEEVEKYCQLKLPCLSC